MYECLCCNYKSKLKQHLEQHLRTRKHHTVYANARTLMEEYEKASEELVLRQTTTLKELYLSQEAERKELELDMRLALCKRLVNLLNETPPP
jgi:hypothetical protein